MVDADFIVISFCELVPTTLSRADGHLNSNKQIRMSTDYQLKAQSLRLGCTDFSDTQYILLPNTCKYAKSNSP